MLSLVASLPRPLLLPLYSPSLRKAAKWSLHATGAVLYFGKRDQVAENVDFLADLAHDLLEITKHPVAARRLQESAQLWRRLYFEGNRKGKQSEAVVTYTVEHDQPIPFDGSFDHTYARILTRGFSTPARQMLEGGHEDLLLKGCDLFDFAHKQAYDVFMGEPSCMPRYKRHGRIALGFVHRMELPYCGTPSLHCTDTGLMYQFARNEGLDYLVGDARELAVETIAAVLRLKQHSLSHVACSLKFQKMVCAARGLEFESIEGVLRSSEFSDRYGIPSAAIDVIFDDLALLTHLREKKSTPNSLLGLVQAYHTHKGFPRAAPGKYNLVCNGKPDPIPYRPNISA